MNLALTDEQEDLRGVLRDFLAQKSSSAMVRRAMDTELGYKPQVWRQLAEQLGVCGLAIAEEYGGVGRGPVELGIALEEGGRALLPGPFFSTVALAGQALVCSGDRSAQARWLPGIAAGTLTATLAVSEQNGSWALDDLTATVRNGKDNPVVSGTKMFVVDGDTAAMLLVVARDETGPGLYAVAGDAPGVTRRRLDVLDPTRRLARVEFDNAPAERVGPAGDSTKFLQRALDLCVVAVAAEQVGGAAACLDDAVAYAKARSAIRSAHRVLPGNQAQMRRHAASRRVGAVGGLPRRGHRQRAGYPTSWRRQRRWRAAYCAGTYTHSAKENIQIHGGIGYTWEHDAQLHLKRAKSSELLFGTPRPAIAADSLSSSESDGTQQHGGYFDAHVTAQRRRGDDDGDETFAARCVLSYRTTIPAALRSSRLTDSPGKKSWLATLFDAGYAGPSWPVEHGGMNLSLSDIRTSTRRSTLARGCPEPWGPGWPSLDLRSSATGPRNKRPVSAAAAARRRGMGAGLLRTRGRFGSPVAAHRRPPRR